MKLAIFLLLVTIVGVAYSGKPEVIKYIHFTVGGKGGDGATGGGVSRKPEDKAVDGPKIIRKIHIIQGGANAVSRAIEILFEKLEKAVATGDTKTVTGIVEKFLIELNELVKTLPAPIRKQVASIIIEISTILKQLKTGNGSLKTIFIEIENILKKIIAGGAGSSSNNSKTILVLIAQLKEAIAAGNINDATSIIEKLPNLLETFAQTLPAETKGLILSVIPKIKELPALLKKGNTKQAITIVLQIITTLTGAIGGTGIGGANQ